MVCFIATVLDVDFVGSPLKDLYYDDLDSNATD